MPRRMLRVLAFFLLVWRAGVVCAQPAATSALDAALAEIDAMAAEAHRKDDVGSVAVGIVSGSELVWTKGYGWADAGAQRPARRDSVYRIGSVTKQFTALALLQLAEQGKLRLTDPVEKYVPEFRRVPALFAEMQKATLVQLATMTSGLAREPGGPPDHSRGPLSGWEQKVLASMPTVRFAHEPGTRFLYSNIGYAILGMALGRAAGLPFVEYVEQRIVRPLGMTRTAFELTAAMREQVASGFEIRDGKADGEQPRRELDGRGYRVPNGALFSTVEDLAKFVAWELGEGPALLKKETQADNYSRVSSADGEFLSGYGVGFQLTRQGDLVAYGHNGSTAGYRAAVRFDRRSKTGVILLAGVAGGEVNVGRLSLMALEKIARARAATPAASAAAPR